MARDLARMLDIPLPDVEAIQAQYNAFNRDGRGVTRDDFPQMLRALTGDHDKVSDTQVSELWRAIDTDGDGRISFAEFLVWHHATCAAPLLSMAAPSKEASVQGKHARSVELAP